MTAAVAGCDACTIFHTLLPTLQSIIALRCYFRNILAHLFVGIEGYEQLFEMPSNHVLIHCLVGDEYFVLAHRLNEEECCIGLGLHIIHISLMKNRQSIAERNIVPFIASHYQLISGILLRCCFALAKGH